ncbi:MAG: hypothetical protein ACYC5X_17955, partial [Syntrophales bacterium]
MRYQGTSVYLYTAERENAIGAFRTKLIGVNPLICPEERAGLSEGEDASAGKGERGKGKGERI